jgi:S1-C subfamily serine protease
MHRTLPTLAIVAVLVPLAVLVTLVAGGGSSDSADSAPEPFVPVVNQVSRAVVQIQTAKGLGSGVVFDGRGDVVTNAHVVAGARSFVVTLAAGDRHPAALVGSDPSHDLAVIRIAGARPAPATFGDSSALQVGDLVVAIGNPLGLRSSVTQGVVSSLARSVNEGNGVTLSPVIQTSAAINPGNSGGALVDLADRVIGIPTLAALDPQFGGAQAPGIGFAIPSNTVKTVAARLTTAG